MRPREKYPDQA